MLSCIKRCIAVGSIALLAACGGGNDQRNLVERAQATPNLNILVEAVSAAGFAPLLSGRDEYTVFAPTNEAFAALLGALQVSKEELLAPANRELLTRVLSYHVVPGKVTANLVPLNTPIGTALEGATFTVTANPLRITGTANTTPPNITQTDIPAINGVIHIIDAVLLPAS
jgi:uncharacterized surface protein with fasciclin (FAS1) repeats